MAPTIHLHCHNLITQRTKIDNHLTYIALNYIIWVIFYISGKSKVTYLGYLPTTYEYISGCKVSVDALKKKQKYWLWFHTMGNMNIDKRKLFFSSNFWETDSGRLKDPICLGLWILVKHHVPKLPFLTSTSLWMDCLSAQEWSRGLMFFSMIRAVHI